MYVYAEICLLLCFSHDFHLLNPFASSSKIYHCASFVEQIKSVKRMSEMSR